KATTTACGLSVGLQRVGMSLDDLDIHPITFPDMVGAFSNGAVDAAMILEPFLARAVQQGTAGTVMWLGDPYPNFSIASIGFADTLYSNRPVAKGFVRAYIRAIREYLAAVASGGAAREEINALVARNTGIDLDTVRAMIPPNYNPNGVPNKDS